MNPELIAWLLSWAVFYTGYSMPDELPVVEFVPHSYFVKRTCFGIDTQKDPCNTRAMYDDNIDGVIFLDEKFENNIGGYVKTIIVHEMVHYLQDLTGDWEGIEDWQEVIRCQERAYRQREAYMVQDKFALDVYSRRRLLPRNYHPCGNN